MSQITSEIILFLYYKTFLVLIVNSHSFNKSNKLINQISHLSNQILKNLNIISINPFIILITLVFKSSLEVALDLIAEYLDFTIVKNSQWDSSQGCSGEETLLEFGGILKTS